MVILPVEVDGDSEGPSRICCTYAVSIVLPAQARGRPWRHHQPSSHSASLTISWIVIWYETSPMRPRRDCNGWRRQVHHGPRGT
jgi:hypothetical protein